MHRLDRRWLTDPGFWCDFKFRVEKLYENVTLTNFAIKIKKNKRDPISMLDNLSNNCFDFISVDNFKKKSR